MSRIKSTFEKLTDQGRKALIPVGRLDYQTEGLLLLTDDGEFAQRISHPRYGCHKTYEVKVKGTPEEADLDRLRKGIVIEGKRTSPCPAPSWPTRSPVSPTDCCSASAAT